MNPEHASRRFRWGFAAMLAALATLGPFSIDAYLPAFEGIQRSLQATPVEIQQTMSAYLFAFGVMFLFHGALSDSYGRRPVILVALAVYSTASIFAELTERLHAYASAALRARLTTCCSLSPARTESMPLGSPSGLSGPPHRHW